MKRQALIYETYIYILFLSIDNVIFVFYFLNLIYNFFSWGFQLWGLTVIQHTPPADDLAEINHWEREAMQPGQDAYALWHILYQVSNEELPRNNLFKINLEFFNFNEVLLKLLIIFVNSKTVSAFKYHFLNLFLTVVIS